MKLLKYGYRSLLVAAAGLFLLTGLLIANGTTSVSAQPASAEDLCTPDVMRLCQDYIPDRNRIVRCLKAKRRQLSPGCHRVMYPKARRKRVRRSRH